MKKIHKLIPAVMLAVGSLEASAQIVYEPFEYGSASIGKNLANEPVSTDFKGYANPMSGNVYFDTGTTSFTNDAKIAGGSLTAPAGLASSAGDSVSYGNRFRSPRVGVANAPFSTGTMYWSALLNVPDLGTVGVDGLPNAPGGSFIAAFNNSTGTQTGSITAIGAALMIRRADITTPGTYDSTTNYQLGIRNGANTTWDTANNYAIGATQFVAASYTFNPGTADDVAKLWVNTASSNYGAAAEPLSPNATFSGLDINATPANNLLASFSIRGENALVPKSIQLDELRIDRTWAQVTPKAGTTWAGTSGANWTGNLPTGVNEWVNFTAAAGGGTVNVDAPKTVGTITIKSTSGYTLSGSAITLDGDSANGGSSAINVIAPIDSTGGAPPVNPVLASSHTISSNLVLNNNLAANIGSSQTLTVSGNISATSQTLTKAGAGTLALTGTNSFASSTVLGGILSANSDAALGAVPGGPATNISLSRATLRLDGSFSTNVNRNLAMFTSGTGGTVDVTTGNTATFAGVISGVNLNKTGPGTLVLGNAGNTYTGTAVNGGAVQVSSDANLGTVPGAPGSNITLNAGTLRFGANFDIHNNRTLVMGASGGTIDTNGFSNTGYGGNIDGPGSLTKAGGGSFSFAGSGTYNNLILKGGTFNVFSDTNLGAIPGVATANNITFDGGGLRITGGFSAHGNRGITVNAGGGSFNTNGLSVDFQQPVVGTGAFTKTNTGTLVVPAVRAGDLTVTGGLLKMTANGTATGVSKVGLLSVTSGLIDLTDNKLITNTAVGTQTAGVYNGVQGLVQSGYGSGVFDGTTGIITSQTDATNGSGLTTLGTTTGAIALSLGPTDTAIWAGQTIDGNSTMVMYTYAGDANLDGFIDGTDYFYIDSNVGSSADGYGNGDFNYDGSIDGTDYFYIDSNITGQGAPFYASGEAELLTGVTAVPEPTSLSLIGLGIATLLGRRSTNRRSLHLTGTSA